MKDIYSIKSRNCKSHNITSDWFTVLVNQGLSSHVLRGIWDIYSRFQISELIHFVSGFLVLKMPLTFLLFLLAYHFLSQNKADSAVVVFLDTPVLSYSHLCNMLMPQNPIHFILTVNTTAGFNILKIPAHFLSRCANKPECRGSTVSRSRVEKQRMINDGCDMSEWTKWSVHVNAALPKPSPSHLL